MEKGILLISSRIIDNVSIANFEFWMTNYALYYEQKISADELLC